MSGGLAYVFDEFGDFPEKRCNTAAVDLEPVIELEDVQILRDLITRHCELTGSRRARWILDNWAETLPRFIKVFPHEYKRVLGLNRPAPAKISEPIPLAVLAEQVQHG
jgi:glutamate synthase domain-containing protein 3